MAHNKQKGKSNDVSKEELTSLLKLLLILSPRQTAKYYVKCSFREKDKKCSGVFYTLTNFAARPAVA